MTRAAQSILVFGIYLLCTAATLMVAPNLLLGLLGMMATTEPWIRVLGMVVGALGSYYIIAARTEFEPFFRASVWIRCVVLVAFAAMAAVGMAPAALIGLGVIDSLGALWTWSALRSPGGAA